MNYSYLLYSYRPPNKKLETEEVDQFDEWKWNEFSLYVRNQQLILLGWMSDNCAIFVSFYGRTADILFACRQNQQERATPNDKWATKFLHYVVHYMEMVQNENAFERRWINFRANFVKCYNWIDFFLFLWTETSLKWQLKWKCGCAFVSMSFMCFIFSDLKIQQEKCVTAIFNFSLSFLMLSVHYMLLNLLFYLLFVRFELTRYQNSATQATKMIVFLFVHFETKVKFCEFEIWENYNEEKIGMAIENHWKHTN